jgi:hypothetical protein
VIVRLQHPCCRYPIPVDVGRATGRCAALSKALYLKEYNSVVTTVADIGSGIMLCKPTIRIIFLDSTQNNSESVGKYNIPISNWAWGIVSINGGHLKKYRTVMAMPKWIQVLSTPSDQRSEIEIYCSPEE